VNSTITGSGGLVKNGPANLALGGANLFSGGVTLNAGGLVLGNDQALGTGTLTVGGPASLSGTGPLALANHITLNADLNTLGDDPLTLDGDIDGAGRLFKLNLKVLALNGNNTYTGGTTVSGGTLVVGSDTALGTGDLAIDGATLQAGTNVTLPNAVSVGGNGVTVDGGSDLALNGALSGTGAITKEGTGTLTLGGSLADYAGNLAVNAGILNATNNYTGGVSVGAGGTANLDGTGNNVTVTGPVAGTLTTGGGDLNVPYGNLPGVTGTVNGTAGTTLNITGDGEGTLPNGVYNGIGNLATAGGTLSVGAGTSVAFNGGSTIGGNLVVDGTLGGPVTVGTGGGVVGGGTISGPVTIDNGTIAPGGLPGATGAAAGSGVPGTVLTTGGLNLGAGATTVVQLAPSGTSDSIASNGATTVGGTLATQPTGSGTYGSKTVYTVIRSTNAINGSYTQIVKHGLPFLDEGVTTDGNNIYVTLSQAGTGGPVTPGGEGIQFNEFPGLNTNETQVATALQNVAASGTDQLPSLLGYLRGLDESQVLSAFNSLTGETYASAAQAELTGQSQYQDSLFYRLKLDRDTGERGTAVFAEPYTSSSDLSSSANVARADYRIHGIIIGTDTDISPDFRAGVHANLANARTEVHSRGDYTDVDQAAIGLHALYFNDQQFWIQGLASYGWHDADSRRRIAVGSYTPEARGDYDGKTTNGAIETGFRFNVGQAMHLEPFVGAYYSKVKYDSFTEKGAGDADLKVGKASATSMQYGAGLRLSGDVDLGVAGTKLHPIAMVRYLHNTKDDTVSVNNSFAGAPTESFTVEGSRPMKNHWQGALGASFDFTPAASAFVYYSTDRATHTRSDAVNLGVRWNF
jgi:fibronectin-binding autotransporter adhesin